MTLEELHLISKVEEWTHICNLCFPFYEMATYGSTTESLPREYGPPPADRVWWLNKEKLLFILALPPETDGFERHGKFWYHSDCWKSVYGEADSIRERLYGTQESPPEE